MDPNQEKSDKSSGAFKRRHNQSSRADVGSHAPRGGMSQPHSSSDPFNHHQPPRHPYMNANIPPPPGGPPVFMQYQPFGNSGPFRFNNMPPQHPGMPMGHPPNEGCHRAAGRDHHNPANFMHDGSSVNGEGGSRGADNARFQRRDHQGARPKTWKYSDRKRAGRSGRKKNCNNSSNVKPDENGNQSFDITSNVGPGSSCVNAASENMGENVAVGLQPSSAVGSTSESEEYDSNLPSNNATHVTNSESQQQQQQQALSLGNSSVLEGAAVAVGVAARGVDNNNTHCDKNLIDEGACCDFDRLYQSQEMYRLSGRRGRGHCLDSDDEMEKDEGAHDVGAADLSDSELDNFDYFSEHEEDIASSPVIIGACGTGGPPVQNYVNASALSPRSRLGCDISEGRGNDEDDTGSDAGDFIDTDLPTTNKHLLSSSDDTGSSSSSDNDLDAGAGTDGKFSLEPNNCLDDQKLPNSGTGVEVGIQDGLVGLHIDPVGNISHAAGSAQRVSQIIDANAQSDTDEDTPARNEDVTMEASHASLPDAIPELPTVSLVGSSASNHRNVNDLNTSFECVQTSKRDGSGDSFSSKDNARRVNYHQNVCDENCENCAAGSSELSESDLSEIGLAIAASPLPEEGVGVTASLDEHRLPANDEADIWDQSIDIDNVDKIFLPMEEEIEPVHRGSMYVGGGHHGGCMHDAAGRASCPSSSVPPFRHPFGGMPSKEFYDLIKTVSTTETCMRFFDKDGLDIQRQPVAAAIGQFDAEDEEEGEGGGSGSGKSERLKVDRVMIWNEYEAYIMQFKQIAVSACGQTAVLNVLKALNIPCEKADVVKAIKTNLRKEDADIPIYLFSRACAGTTAEELMAGVDNLSQGKVGGRFFHFWPPRKVKLLKWLAYWMNKGAIPVATLNLQQGPHSLWQLPDSWHHQMVYGVSPQGLYLTNPLEIVSERTAMRQVCSDSVLKVRRQDVISRFRDSTDLRQLLSHPDKRWRTMNVMGQVINVLREFNMPSVPGYRLQVTSHISLPAAYKAGVTLFMPKDGQHWRSLMESPELALEEAAQSAT